MFRLICIPFTNDWAVMTQWFGADRAVKTGSYFECRDYILTETGVPVVATA